MNTYVKKQTKQNKNRKITLVLKLALCFLVSRFPPFLSFPSLFGSLMKKHLFDSNSFSSLFCRLEEMLEPIMTKNMFNMTLAPSLNLMFMVENINITA